MKTDLPTFSTASGEGLRANVELYLSSEISYQDLALQEGITNPSMIVNWVNRFRVPGPDALRPRKKGRKKTLNTSGDNTQNKPVEESSVDTSAEHVKELEEELLKLRIENAFLKELRRLRLEDEGDKIGQGRENAKTYIHENPAFFDMLEAKVRDFYFTQPEIGRAHV